MVDERPAPPVHGDMAEQSVLDPIELASPWREVRDGDGQADLGGEKNRARASTAAPGNCWTRPSPRRSAVDATVGSSGARPSTTNSAASARRRPRCRGPSRPRSIRRWQPGRRYRRGWPWAPSGRGSRRRAAPGRGVVQRRCGDAHPRQRPRPTRCRPAEAFKLTSRGCCCRRRHPLRRAGVVHPQGPPGSPCRGLPGDLLGAGQPDRSHPQRPGGAGRASSKPTASNWRSSTPSAMGRLPSLSSRSTSAPIPRWQTWAGSARWKPPIGSTTPSCATALSTAPCSAPVPSALSVPISAGSPGAASDGSPGGARGGGRRRGGVTSCKRITERLWKHRRTEPREPSAADRTAGGGPPSEAHGVTETDRTAGGGSPGRPGVTETDRTAGASRGRGREGSRVGIC